MTIVDMWDARPLASRCQISQRRAASVSFRCIKCLAGLLMHTHEWKGSASLGHRRGFNQLHYGHAAQVRAGYVSHGEKSGQYEQHLRAVL